MLHFALGKAYLDLGRLRGGVPASRSGQSAQAVDVCLRSGGERALDGEHRRGLFAGTSRGQTDRGARSGFRSSSSACRARGRRSIEQILASHPLAHGAGELKTLQALVGRTGISRLRPHADPRALRGARRRLSRRSPRLVGGPAACGRQDAVQLPLCGPHPPHAAGRAHHPLPARSRRHVPLLLHQALRRRAGLRLRSAELGRFHRAYQALMAHWRAVLPASHFLEVDYEASWTTSSARRGGCSTSSGCRGTRGARFHETRAAGPHRERQPGSRADLRDLRRALEQARRAAAAAARGAGR